MVVRSEEDGGGERRGWGERIKQEGFKFGEWPGLFGALRERERIFEGEQ